MWGRATTQQPPPQEHTSWGAGTAGPCCGLSPSAAAAPRALRSPRCYLQLQPMYGSLRLQPCPGRASPSGKLQAGSGVAGGSLQPFSGCSPTVSCSLSPRCPSALWKVGGMGVGADVGCWWQKDRWWLPCVLLLSWCCPTGWAAPFRQLLPAPGNGSKKPSRIQPAALTLS